jgi:hypothetical protein
LRDFRRRSVFDFCNTIDPEAGIKLISRYVCCWPTIMVSATSSYPICDAFIRFG